jgi:riboflavin synthase
MFTGLVEALGTVQAVQADGPGRILRIAEPTIEGDLKVGDSVAINGVCLTAIERGGGRFAFAAGPETLRLSNLGELSVGDRVNLERALRVGDRLGGHIVQGHVDGVGRITRREIQGEWETVWFSCPPELTREMVRKGSIAVDGVSLTLVDVGSDSFSVALIPHTLQMTTLGFKKAGDTVNLETDIFGKYAAKLSHAGADR